MKNLIIFFPSFERGGAENILINLVNSFGDGKLYIHLITNCSKKIFYKSENLRIYNFEKKKIKFINNRITSSFSASFVLIKLLFKLKNSDTKILSMQSNFLSVIIAFFLNYKVAIRVSEDPCGATKFANNKFFAFLIMLSKILTYNLATKIICNGSKSKDCLKKMTINKSKVKILFNPYLQKINKFKIKKKKNIFLNIGRLCKQKNQTCLINAFYLFNKMNDSYSLIICGDGPDKNKLKKLTLNLNLKKKVLFVNWKKNLEKIYFKSKFFVLPSLYEGMPNVIIDSINYNLPSICSDASGIDDLLLKGKGGEIIKNIDHVKLYKKMIHSENNYKKILNKTKLAKKHLNKYLIFQASGKFKHFLRNI
jgi:glycosyltransferase involved in cell wall biosynthesis